MMTSQEEPQRSDLGKYFADLEGKDIADELMARLGNRRPAAAPTPHVVNNCKTESGDIINLGTMPPEAVQAFLAARRKR